jgi:hypothetical protein
VRGGFSRRARRFFRASVTSQKARPRRPFHSRQKKAK